jgi:hypothetical protein
MKLIKQTILVFQEGRSDKVYEIDLCEVGPNRYVVNFRYGRRGSDLKEGAKTTSAVPLAEAEKVFATLVAEKNWSRKRPKKAIAMLPVRLSVRRVRRSRRPSEPRMKRPADRLC